MKLLSHAMTGGPSAELAGVLDRLRAGEACSPGERPVDVRVLSVSARPFSDVARIELLLRGGAARLVAKIPRCRPGKTDRRVQQLEREFEAARQLAVIFRGEDGLGVPRALAFFPDVPALVWSEVQGITLDTMVPRLARGVPRADRIAVLEGACRAAGRWLRVLQDATPAEGRLSLKEMAEYVDVRLERIAELGPGRLGVNWKSSVRRVFEDVEPAQNDLRLAGVHGDFSLSNIMHGEHGVVALDFTRFGTGSIYYDAARLYHQLGLLLHKPWFLASTIGRLRQALLAGYDPHLRADRPVFQLFVIQHLLCHWLGRLKTTSAPYHVRTFDHWTGYRHRRELDGLIARLSEPARSERV
jgi:hypothetical protein